MVDVDDFSAEIKKNIQNSNGVLCVIQRKLN